MSEGLWTPWGELCLFTQGEVLTSSCVLCYCHRLCTEDHSLQKGGLTGEDSPWEVFQRKNGLLLDKELLARIMRHSVASLKQNWLA